MEDVLAILDHAHGSPIRVLRAKTEAAAIAYNVSVPDQLHPVVILDASYPICELEKIDKTISEDDWFAAHAKAVQDGRAKPLKQYSNVIGHLWKRGSGRSSLRRDAKTIAAKIVQVVMDEIAPTEAVLFVHHLHRSGRGEPNMAELIRQGLAEREIDSDAAKLPDGRPRFGWLTFGSETSVNGYSRTENVIFAGTYFKPHRVIAAGVAGQDRDLLRKVTSAEIDRVTYSETACSIYQALSRGSCRVVDNGEARPMRFWLPLAPQAAEDVLGHLRARMPGLRWMDWVSNREDQVRAALVTYLRRLPAEVHRVASRTVRREAALAAVPRGTFLRAKAAALKKELAGEWSFEGSSFVRAAK